MKAFLLGLGATVIAGFLVGALGELLKYLSITLTGRSLANAPGFFVGAFSLLIIFAIGSIIIALIDGLKEVGEGIMEAFGKK